MLFCFCQNKQGKTAWWYAQHHGFMGIAGRITTHDKQAKPTNTSNDSNSNSNTHNKQAQPTNPSSDNSPAQSQQTSFVKTRKNSQDKPGQCSPDCQIF